MTAANLEFDDGGASTRIGLVVLATDLATERDFRAGLAGQPVEFHTTRILNQNPISPENLRSMGPRLAASAALLLPGMPLDVIAYSSTSASVVLGPEVVREQIQAGRPGLPVVTPATAALAAFERFSVRRLALLTPYIDEIGEEVAAWFAEHGIEVVAARHLGIESDVPMAFLSAPAIESNAREVDHPQADALFISCTAIRAMERLQALEEALGKPCLSSNQCLLWEALRRGGYRGPIAGYGQLLERWL